MPAIVVTEFGPIALHKIEDRPKRDGAVHWDVLGSRKGYRRRSDLPVQSYPARRFSSSFTSSPLTILRVGVIGMVSMVSSRSGHFILATPCSAR